MIICINNLLQIVAELLSILDVKKSNIYKLM